MTYQLRDQQQNNEQQLCMFPQKVEFVFQFLNIDKCLSFMIVGLTKQIDLKTAHCDEHVSSFSLKF